MSQSVTMATISVATPRGTRLRLTRGLDDLRKELGVHPSSFAALARMVEFKESNGWIACGSDEGLEAILARSDYEKRAEMLPALVAARCLYTLLKDVAGPRPIQSGRPRTLRLYGWTPEIYRVHMDLYISVWIRTILPPEVLAEHRATLEMVSGTDLVSGWVRAILAEGEEVEVTDDVEGEGQAAVDGLGTIGATEEERRFPTPWSGTRAPAPVVSPENKEAKDRGPGLQFAMRDVPQEILGSKAGNGEEEGSLSSSAWQQVDRMEIDRMDPEDIMRGGASGESRSRRGKIFDMYREPKIRAMPPTKITWNGHESTFLQFKQSFEGWMRQVNIQYLDELKEGYYRLYSDGASTTTLMEFLHDNTKFPRIHPTQGRYDRGVLYGALQSALPRGHPVFFRY